MTDTTPADNAAGPAPAALRDVPLTMRGDPNGGDFELKVGDLDILDRAIVTKVTVVAEADYMPKALIEIEVHRLDALLRADVALGDRTVALLRHFGWTPPPPAVPAHGFVSEQPGTCVLYVGPRSVCGARPEDPIHETPKSVTG